MFVVAGVSGHTGSVVARTLLESGKKVRVLVRDAKKGEEWSAKGAEVAVASVEDVGALTKALQGAEGAYLLLPPPPLQITGIRDRATKISESIATAIDAAGPAHVVFLSTIGAERDDAGMISTLRIVEDRLRKTKPAITFLRAAYFVENAGSVLPLAAAQGILPTNLAADVKIPQVTTDDIGRTAAKLLLEGAKPGQKGVVNLAGKEDLSPNDVAKIASDVLGKPVQVVASPPDASMVKTLQSFGFSEEYAEKFREMVAAINDGKVKPVAGEPLLRGKQSARDVIAKLLGK
jgi:uncharacterized protein YbjT (DUF2867 family)